MIRNKDSKTIRYIFNKVSSKYDFLNNLLSFGLHKLWKKKLIKILKPSAGESWADLCCGTGDLTLLIRENLGKDGLVFGVDSAIDILEIAKEKSDKFSKDEIHWIEKDIFALDDSKYKFDGICMSYGLRNLKSVECGIIKVFDLLKENGRAGFLDFNHPEEDSLASLFQKIFLRYLVVPIAGIFKLHEEYAYIENSIRSFPKGKNLIEISIKNGFRKASYRDLMWGQMGILLIEK